MFDGLGNYPISKLGHYSGPLQRLALDFFNKRILAVHIGINVTIAGLDQAAFQIAIRLGRVETNFYRYGHGASLIQFHLFFPFSFFLFNLNEVPL